MPFERDDYEVGMVQSPGGFEFGIQGFTYGPPIPKSITFFLDGSAMLCDQYGRVIRRALNASGQIVLFADTPPDANRDGTIHPRPQFANHAQTLQTLKDERVNWLAYEVRYVSKNGGHRAKGGLNTMEDAKRVQEALLRDGNGHVTICHEIVSAGWPQLPYEELKKLPLSVFPPVESEDPSLRDAYLRELRKIPDPELRKAAIRFRHEMDIALQVERDTVEAEYREALHK